MKCSFRVRPMVTSRAACILCLQIVVTLPLIPGSSVQGDEIDFSRDVLPLLSENCFACHGPDEQHRAADLRLDRHEDALAAIVPGAPENSELLRRILSDVPDEKMPPADSNRKLTPAQIEILRRWIQSGAKWEQHWSFDALEKPELPEPVFPEFPQHNPIDLFVQQRLRAEQLTPSPEADRRTLIRRLTLDLTGLPPAPSDVDAFLQDPSPDAYERLVDRLLQSPAYGERMAWDWMYAARYADSNGYQGDNER
ncbi:MAG: DUF1549 domain-containing protein, partial [Planctomycetaceae bacterium]|nr:DUF1549 domain-containing protein [Planctomycetaceae bacterium]